VAEETATEANENAGIVGKWSYREVAMKMDITLNLNEDGSYNMMMGTNETAKGTWVKTGSDIKLTNSKSGTESTWEIREQSEDKLGICWNPGNAKEKVLPFERVK